VRKLVGLTKPGAPVIIVYSNPNTAISMLPRALRRLRLAHHGSIEVPGKAQHASLYFYAHPIEWWSRFSDIASVKIVPWRSMASAIQKRIVPNNKIGKAILAQLFSLEERFPDFFVNHFQYPMIVLRKNAFSAHAR
jgi:hypothetical protein